MTSMPIYDPILMKLGLGMAFEQTTTLNKKFTRSAFGFSLRVSSGVCMASMPICDAILMKLGFGMDFDPKTTLNKKLTLSASVFRCLLCT